MLKLHVLGVGDAFTERYHNACLCIEEPSSGLRLLIDCPPALPRVLADHRQRSGSDLSVWNIEHLLGSAQADLLAGDAATERGIGNDRTLLATGQAHHYRNGLWASWRWE